MKLASESRIVGGALDLSQAILLILFLAYFIPVSALGSHTLIPVVQGAALLLFLAMQPQAAAPRGALTVAFGFSALMILLTVLALAVDFERSIARDYAEIGKYGLVLLAFVAGAFMASIRQIDRKVEIACIVAASLFALVGLAESSLAGVADVISNLYGRDRSVLQGKPIFSLWTTYFAASMYAFLAAVLIASVVTSRARWYSHVLIGLMFLLILLTQSRSGFFALGVLGLVYLAALGIRYGRGMVALLVLIVTPLALAVVFVMGNALIDRFAYLFFGINNYVFGFFENVDGENSLGYRVGQIIWAIENNFNVIFGGGIGKGYNEYLESFFSLYYYRYGIIGCVVYIVLWGAPGLYLIKNVIERKKMSTTVASVGIFVLTLPFLSISGVITDQLFFLSVYYVALGIWYGRIFVERGAQGAAVTGKGAPVVFS